MALVVFSVFCTSCSHKLGYSVVLWSMPEQRLYAGDLVQVYIKSNISKVYVIAHPNSQEKIEVPFWQISEPQSKKKALQAYEEYREYQSIYARVASDGLPIRFEPVNTSRQVYRLRQNEIIKVLKKGTGVAPSAGAKALDGEWLWVMTSDGSTGWCFSYNLRLFDENAPIINEEQTESYDEALETMLASYWVPESYKKMLDANQVDIEKFEKNYHFEPENDSSHVTLATEDLARSWQYKGTVKLDNGSYRFKETPIVVSITGANTINVQYTDDNGRTHTYPFVTMDKSIDDIIASEQERRLALFERLQNTATSYTSANYGKLYLLDNNRFVWQDYQKLMPQVISAGSGTSGTIEFNYFMDVSLGADYDGVITFAFSANGKRVPFLYKLEQNGIRLEETTHASFKDALITNRASNALVLFFSTEN